MRKLTQYFVALSLVAGATVAASASAFQLKVVGANQPAKLVEVPRLDTQFFYDRICTPRGYCCTWVGNGSPTCG